MPTHPIVSIIVVSYNTRELTLEALRSARDQTTVPAEFIVVDNNSSDGSAQAIAAEFPEMTLMAESENHGFAKSNNLAAKRCKGEFLLLLNPDTITLDGAIDKMVAFAKRQSDAQIWGAKTLYADHSLNTTNCWQRMTIWNLFCRLAGLARAFPNSALFNPEGYGGWDRNGTRHVDIVTGCFFLIPRLLWEDLDGFDLTYWMYGEEADLCHRARKRGAHPMIDGDIEVVHYGGASEKVRADKMVRLLSAKALLIKRHFPAWQRPLGLLLLRLWPATRAWAAIAARRKSWSDWVEIWRRRAEWQDGYQESQ